MMAKQTEQQEEEKKEVTLDSILKELPIPEEHKQAINNLLTNLATSVVETKQQLAEMNLKLDQVEAGASKATAETYKGLSADQIYQIEMAKATGPAQQAQHQLLQMMLGGTRSSGGGLDELIKDADKFNALRSIFAPPPTPLQIATDKAQVFQMLAQTRLMNKVIGKATDSYLDKLEAGLGEPEGEE